MNIIKATWLKPYIPYIDMNTDPRKQVKDDFEKGFFLSRWIMNFWNNHRKGEKTQWYQTCN